MKNRFTATAIILLVFGIFVTSFAAVNVSATEISEDKAEKLERARELNEARENNSTDSGEAVSIDMEDGEYAIGITMEGGSGRSTITSPATLIVNEGKAYARIEWSSQYYDYMKVGGKKYLRLNDEGYSLFEIPVTALDKPMNVIGDTTAMSVPHEIEYQLTFHTDEITSLSDTPQAAAKKCVFMGLGIMAVCIAIAVVRRARKKKGK